MERKPFTTSIEEKLLKQVKKLAIDLDCNVNKLIEEGIKHVLSKHHKKEQKK